MRINSRGFHWGLSYLKPEYRKKGREPYYFCWGIMDKEMREEFIKDKKDNPKNTGPIGIFNFWYDRPHVQLNLYFICFYWSTQWSKYVEVNYLNIDGENK